MSNWYHPTNPKPELLEKSIAMLLGRLITAGLVATSVFFIQMRYHHFYNASTTDSHLFWGQLAILAEVAGIISFSSLHLLSTNYIHPKKRGLTLICEASCEFNISDIDI